MAKEVQSKKRKASVPEGGAEKMKKIKKAEKVTTEVAADPVKKRKATEDAAPAAVKKTKTPKSILKDTPKEKPIKKNTTSDKAGEKTNGNTESSKTSKPSKVAKSAEKELKPVKATKIKETRKPKPADPVSDAEDNNEAEAEDDNEESEIDDQTDALLKGFESDSDDDDKEGGLEEGDEVPEVPAITKKEKKQIQLAADRKDEKSGVVYVGRIPHGFYEHEMREYFKQFGTILQLRLSRNRRTGRSKHIAWIKFESATVAGIVAKTMDNYLLFSHILKVKIVPDEQIPEDLFKGANKRFKHVPWNKIEGRKLKLAKPESAWEKQSENEQRRRDKKAEKLKAIGYEFESPKIKSAKGIGRKIEEPALVAEIEGEVELEVEDELKAVEAAPVEKAKKEKKERRKENRQAKNALRIEASKTGAEDDAAPTAEESAKPNKDKKRMAAEVEEASVPATAVTVEPTEKVFKTKKAKTVTANSEVPEVKAKSQRKKGKDATA